MRTWFWPCVHSWFMVEVWGRMECKIINLASRRPTGYFLFPFCNLQPWMTVTQLLSLGFTIYKMRRYLTHFPHHVDLEGIMARGNTCQNWRFLYYITPRFRCLHRQQTLEFWRFPGLMDASFLLFLSLNPLKFTRSTQGSHTWLYSPGKQFLNYAKGQKVIKSPLDAIFDSPR